MLTQAPAQTTKQRILRSAIEVLIDNGFAKLTIKDVAAHAGMAFGNLTYHYPTKDLLVAAMLERVLDDYRSQFTALGQRVDGVTPSVDDLVQWVLDDALTTRTARLFTELWAVSNRDPALAAQVASLYDHAVDSFMRALGAEPLAADAAALRSSLYFFACISEGSSAIFGNRSADHPERAHFKRLAKAVLVPLITQCLPPVAGPETKR